MSQTGITYYKLEALYPGDVTKGCGLTGSEIDKNFHFLRGYDVKNAKIDEEAGTIILERVNCEVIVIEGVKEYIKKVSYAEGFNLSGSTYDPIKGILHIIVNGEDFPVEGFYTHVIGGDGIKGSGTYGDPLKVDGLLLTGFFSPVKKFLDYEMEEKLPEIGDRGDRFLTREYSSPYGLEYSFSGVQKIESILASEKHGWRVPTVEDWDAMLNALECPEFRNHRNHIENSENGKLAGFLLKDEIWDEEKKGIKGFKSLPTEKDVWNSEYTIYWSSTDDGNGGKHAKSLHKGLGTVQHRVENTDVRNLHSLRLVRNLDAPFCPVEVINGVAYNCVLMKAIDKNGKEYSLSWTLENVSFNDLLETREAKYPTIFESGEYKYYINEWNCSSEMWDKREFVDHSVITIKEYSGYTEPEEFILKNGVLEPYFDSIYGKIKEYVDAKVAAEAEERISADDALNSKIEGEIAQRTAEVKDLSERLMTESAERQAEDSSLSQRIATESAERQAEDSSLSQRIATESAERQAEDSSLSQRITSEATTRQAEDNRIETKVDIEIAERKAECASLSQRIVDEATERINHDIQVKQYNATVNGVTLNTNDGTEIKVIFDGSFGKVDFYNE